MVNWHSGHGLDHLRQFSTMTEVTMHRMTDIPVRDFDHRSPSTMSADDIDQRSRRIMSVTMPTAQEWSLVMMLWG
ncbi:hypothetical protein [Sphingobium sp. RAC03]|uniref:hypothetical protein n=1 Tax=Sphingobium sp. RAC03 TaxID=1843368 RepID=UPI001237362C|nr:hypothetical protein [Sphingobium sp. RAC03]